MPAQDLILYQRYEARRMFPGRRVEKLLAQVSMVLAQVNGNKAKLSDFLFDPPPEGDGEEFTSDPDAIASALSFAPRKRPPRADERQDDGKQPG